MPARIAMLLLLLPAALAIAAPPVLNIDNGPLVVACSPAASAGAASGERLLRVTTSGKSELYQSTVNVGDWSGHLSRYILPNGAAAAAPTLIWDAGAVLTGSDSQPPTPPPAQRHIYTSIVQPDGRLIMVPFFWQALSPAQQALLNSTDNAGEQRLAYLRGERALEGKQFRPRSSVLGDSVHATPVYAGDHETVYVGANDGMLHAFDAQTGVELFAYVPDAVFAQLHYLSDPSYKHRAYVDGPASVADADINGSKQRILLSAMGGGAQGVFALDVTDPAHFADGLGAVWEFTDRDDPMMGNVTSLPQIAKLRIGDAYRHFAIVASGINNYAADGHAASAGKGALFLLALDKPHDEAWQLNVNYYRLITPISDATLANALSAPVLLNGPDGALRLAYAGDLQGNLWRFDFDGKAPWPNAVGPGKGKAPLFVARDAAGKRQPITEQPLLAYANGGGYVVMFGTGQLIESADRSTGSASQQSYYAIIDSLRNPPDLVSGRKQLTQRFVDAAGDLFSISGTPIENGSKGWFVDFPQAGERSIANGTLVDGELVFNTIQPDEDACSAPHGRSYAVNALSGLPDGSVTVSIQPDTPAMASLPLPEYASQPALLPQSVATTSGAAGSIEQQKSYAMASVTTAGVTQLATVKTRRRAGRLSWREVANWRELHEAAK